MNKKGFTLIEILGVILLIAIVGGLVVVSASHVIKTGKIGAYKSYEKMLLLSTENYLTDYPDEEPFENTFKKIPLIDLISNGYLEKFNSSGGEVCSEDNSYALVVRKDPEVISRRNYKLDYLACLVCLNGDSIVYTSDECVDLNEEEDGISFTLEHNQIYNKTTTNSTVIYSGHYRGISYSSSNSDVASVDINGVVKGNSVGTAIITATLTDNVGVITKRTQYIEVLPLMANQIEYDPPKGITCEGGVACDNSQLMIDKLSGIFKR